MILGQQSSGVLPTPQRLSDLDVVLQAQQVSHDDVMTTMLNAFPGPAIIVNDRRQIVAANDEFIGASFFKHDTASIGLRPGEALGCVESNKVEAGCGAAPNCAYCGAGKHFQQLEEGTATQVTTECLITREVGNEVECMEFTASISKLPGGWTLVALKDVSSEKRRKVLERCFFHDLMNSAGGLQGLAELIEDQHGQDGRLLSSASKALVDELDYHRTLLMAESGTYQVQLQEVDLREIAIESRSILENNPNLEHCHIDVHGQERCVTDRVLIRRVIVNLLKNACEAVNASDTVEISIESVNGDIWLSISNPGQMSAQAQANVFKRSFSTKATTGRGIGTWSVRLLTENYLGGQASFTCSGGKTAFVITIPQ